MPVKALQASVSFSGVFDFPREPVVSGRVRFRRTFEGRQPVLMVKDPEVLRQIFVKEFEKFPTRRVSVRVLMCVCVCGVVCECVCGEVCVCEFEKFPTRRVSLCVC